MQCEEVRNELAGRLVSDLDAARALVVREHLAGCAACRADAEMFEETWTALDELPPVAMDSAAMRARFDAALDVYREGLSGNSGHGRHLVSNRMGGWRPTGLLGQAAAAFLLFAIGLGAGRELWPSTRTPASDPMIAALRQELETTRRVVMLSLLQQQSAAERLRGVSWSRQIDQPGNEVVAALVDSLMHDSNVNVRLACIDALRRFSSRADVRQAAVDAMAEQPSPLVQIALIDFVVDANDRDALEMLRRLASDVNQDATVRRRASEGMQRLG